MNTSRLSKSPLWISCTVSTDGGKEVLLVDLHFKLVPDFGAVQIFQLLFKFFLQKFECFFGLHVKEKKAAQVLLLLLGNRWDLVVGQVEVDGLRRAASD